MSFGYINSHYKNKMLFRPPYIYNPKTGKTPFLVDKTPQYCFLKRILFVFPIYNILFGRHLSLTTVDVMINRYLPDNYFRSALVYQCYRWTPYDLPRDHCLHPYQSPRRCQLALWLYHKKVGTLGEKATWNTGNMYMQISSTHFKRKLSPDNRPINLPRTGS